MVAWECSTNPREASGLDPEAVHASLYSTDHLERLETRKPLNNQPIVDPGSPGSDYTEFLLSL